MNRLIGLGLLVGSLLVGTTLLADEEKTLQEQIQQRQQEWAQKADDETKRIYQAGIEKLAKSGLLDKALHTGDQAALFTTKDIKGEPVSLQELLRKGPVVLVWYRGGWCPYCNLTLRAYQKIQPELEKLGATLVALAPEKLEYSQATAEKNQLDMILISDVGNKIARQYNLVFQLPPEVVEKYNRNFSVSDYNGDTSYELPLAATFIINQDGKIVYSFFKADYRERAEPTEVLQEVKELVQQNK